MKRMYKPTSNPVWKEDLIMCPSQCFCFFIAEGKRYCIYLRWRHGDPWTAQLLPEDKEKEICYYLYWEWLNPFGAIADRLDEIYGGQGEFDKYFDSHIELIREAYETIEQIC